jgi:hypothetical protein
VVFPDPEHPQVVIRTHVLGEDDWLYTEESLRGIREAKAEIAAGFVYRLAPSNLEKLGQLAELPESPERSRMIEELIASFPLATDPPPAP